MFNIIPETYIEPESVGAKGHVALVVVVGDAPGLGPDLAPRGPHPRAPFLANSPCRRGVFVLGSHPGQARGQKYCHT